MRNLKRALSLALATVMTLGLMVVGTSAAGYDDVTSEDNVEAIEVLQAVGIMTGDENGNFNPDANVTRNEMAVIMSQLLNLDYNYYRGTNPFTDVPSWAAPYVAACAAEGVVAGIGDGLYGGDNNVTAAQAALMIMKALGYFQYQADFGDDWQIATIRQASYINLFDRIDANAEAALTRNQIAQLVLNGLKANMVTFTGTVGATVGDVVIGYNPEYTARTNAASKYNTIDVGTSNIGRDDQYYIQLGEELYDGDLQLDNDAIDVFGRPSRYWEYDGDEIGTYAKVELMVVSYTEGVEGGDVYNDIGSAACDYELAYYVDGAEMNQNDTAVEAAKLERRNDDTLGETGRGVLTEVYVDSRAEETTIVETHTYLAIAQSDYNERNENIRLDVYYGVHDNNPTGTAEPVADVYRATVALEDQPVIEGMEADDIVMVTMAAPDHSYVADRDDYTIESIADPEIVSGVTLTDYSVGDYEYDDEIMPTLSDLTADGTRYNTSKDAIYDEELLFNYSGDVESQLRDATYDIYLDAYGNILGLEQVDANDSYLFVVGYDVGSDILAKAIDRALVIFPDGTMEQVDIDDSKLQVYDNGEWVDAPNNRLVNADEESVNAWFTYTVDEDGLYTLRRMVRNQGVENRAANDEDAYIDSMHGTLTYQNGTNSYRATGHDLDAAVAYGNNDSVYITVKANDTVNADNSIVEVRGVTTGLRNASIRPESASFDFSGYNYNSNV